MNKPGRQLSHEISHRKRWDLRFFCIILLFSYQCQHTYRSISFLHDLLLFANNPDSIQLQEAMHCSWEMWTMKTIRWVYLFWNCTVQYFRVMTWSLEPLLFRLHTFSVKLKGWCYGVRERILLKLSVLFWWSHVRSPWDVFGRVKGVRGAYIRCLNYVRHRLSEVWDPKGFSIFCLYSWDSKLGMSREDPWRHSVRSGSVLLA